MSGLYLALVRARWIENSFQYESPDGRGTRTSTSFHLQVEVTQSFAGTDGKLKYWFREEPVVLHRTREVVIAAGLQYSVRPLEGQDKVVCPAVGQIIWNGQLTEELFRAEWNLGDLMPRPTSQLGAYERTWLVRWQTHGAYPDRAEVFPDDVQSEFKLGSDWKWDCLSPLPCGKKVEGLVKLQPKPESVPTVKSVPEPAGNPLSANEVIGAAQELKNLFG